MSNTIWKKQVELKDINGILEDTLCSHLGMEIVELGQDYIVGRMPVDARTHQPMGLLHGGATAALAESLGSIASYLCVAEEDVVGTELNISHLSSAKSGFVYGRAIPLHIGKRMHAWQIDLNAENGKPIAQARLRIIVI